MREEFVHFSFHFFIRLLIIGHPAMFVLAHEFNYWLRRTARARSDPRCGSDSEKQNQKRQLRQCYMSLTFALLCDVVRDSWCAMLRERRNLPLCSVTPKVLGRRSLIRMSKTFSKISAKIRDFCIVDWIDFFYRHIDAADLLEGSNIFRKWLLQ